jgi:hypothetical protein
LVESLGLTVAVKVYVPPVCRLTLALFKVMPVTG